MRTATLILLALAASRPAPGAAQVTFDEALALGARSPAAQAAERMLEARRAGDADIGGTAQATQVTVMPGAVLTPDQERGFELQINATQGWNLADLGGARRHAAAQERRALAARARADALRARLEAARGWIGLRTLESLDRILREQSTVARRLVASTERAAELGVATAADVADAHAALAELEQQRLTLEGSRFEASNQLALAMGRPADAPLHTAGPAPDPRLPAARALRRRIASVEALPAVAALRLTVSAARAREAEASAQYAPVLSVGAQLERTAGDAWILYGVAGVSFSAFGQADRATSLARAEAEAAASEADAARLSARADLAAALHEVEHTRRQLESIERRLLPALEALRDRRRRALELGEGTVFAALESERRFLLARELRSRARGERRWAEVRLWLLLAELERGTEGTA